MKIYFRSYVLFEVLYKDMLWIMIHWGIEHAVELLEGQPAVVLG